ncbi:MAG: TIGR02147 family protein [Bdellovibrionota bacterium]
MPLRNYQDYRDILKAILSHRKKKNPAYSMRAFARNIGISPSRLSEVLNSNRSLSIRMAKIIATNAFDTLRDQEYFTNLVILESKTSKFIIDAARKRIEQYRSDTQARTLTSDELQDLNKWHDMAILQLIKQRDTIPEIDEIASRLGIEKNQADRSLQKLHTLGFLNQELSKQRYLNVCCQAGPLIPKEDMADIQKQLFQLYQQRNLSECSEQISSHCQYLSIPDNKIEIAKDILQNCHRQLVEEAQSPNTERIFCLSTNFFEITLARQCEF